MNYLIAVINLLVIISTLDLDFNITFGLVPSPVPGTVLHAGQSHGEGSKASASPDFRLLPVIVVEDGLIPLNVSGGGGTGVRQKGGRRTAKVNCRSLGIWNITNEL